MVNRDQAMWASQAIVEALGLNVAQCVTEIGEMFNREGENYAMRDEIQARWGVSDTEMQMAVRIIQALCE